jgi:antitoxin component YwqK of YwqJK toxin-antitoxin module
MIKKINILVVFVSFTLNSQNLNDLISSTINFYDKDIESDVVASGYEDEFRKKQGIWEFKLILGRIDDAPGLLIPNYIAKDGSKSKYEILGKGNYVNNLKHGEWVFTYISVNNSPERLFRIINYNMGIIEGKQVIIDWTFNENLHLTVESSWKEVFFLKDGKINGKHTITYNKYKTVKNISENNLITDKLIESFDTYNGDFDNGLPIIEKTFFNKNNPESIITYELQEGKSFLRTFKLFYENSKILASVNYIGNKKITIFYPSGQLKTLVTPICERINYDHIRENIQTILYSSINKKNNYVASEDAQIYAEFKHALIEGGGSGFRSTGCDYQNNVMAMAYLSKTIEDYYPNGQIKTKYDDSSKETTNFYENGTIESVGKFIINKKEEAQENGFWKEYYENGNIKSITNYLTNQCSSCYDYSSQIKYNEYGDLESTFSLKEGVRIEEKWLLGKIINSKKTLENFESEITYYYENDLLKYTSANIERLKTKEESTPYGSRWLKFTEIEYYDNNGKVIKRERIDKN